MHQVKLKNKQKWKLSNKSTISFVVVILVIGVAWAVVDVTRHVNPVTIQQVKNHNVDTKK